MLLVDGGGLGVSGYRIRGEAPINLTAQEVLNSLVACDRLENQFEHRQLAGRER